MNAYANEHPPIHQLLDRANRPQAVVIGTGFGGLAAAIRLHHKGYAVSMYEKLDAPGGRAYVHHQDGFAFDAGPTIITAPFLLEELWALCGKKLQDDVTLVPMDPFYRIFFDNGEHIDFHHDPERMRETGPRAVVVEIPGCGHAPALNTPEQIGLIERFLDILAHGGGRQAEQRAHAVKQAGAKLLDVVRSRRHDQCPM